MTCHRAVIRFKWVWLVQALNFFPDDVPQVAEYTVEEIGESSESMERKSQWQRMTKETGLLVMKEASRASQG